MERRSVTAFSVPAVLYFLSGLTLIISGLRVFEILTGTVPTEALRLDTAPISHLAHVAGGFGFALLGPIQFGRVLARRFGRLHRVLGRVFVICGAFLSLSSLTLLWHFPTEHPPLVSIGRLVFGAALGVALFLAMRAIYARDIARHRDWMIRAYAIGVGATVVSVAFVPIYVATGVPPSGMFADVLFIGLWAGCVAFAEVLVHRLNRATPERTLT